MISNWKQKYLVFHFTVTLTLADSQKHFRAMLPKYVRTGKICVEIILDSWDFTSVAYLNEMEILKNSTHFPFCTSIYFQLALSLICQKWIAKLQKHWRTKKVHQLQYYERTKNLLEGIIQIGSTFYLVVHVYWSIGNYTFRRM